MPGTSGGSPGIGTITSSWSQTARTRQLLRSIGLENELRWVQTKSGFYAGPEIGIKPFSTAIDLLRLPTLNAIDKARLGATILAGARHVDVERMEERAAREWLTTWSGRRAFDRFWLPLLRAKLGDGWRQASAGFVAANIRRLYTARGSVLRAERLGYVPGGYARILDCFTASLTDSGVKINTDSAQSGTCRRAPAASRCSSTTPRPPSTGWS